jgi:hypothetical protein
MNNNKQSSVDILCQKLANKLGLQAITFYIDHAEEIAEAKSMHKEEIKKAQVVAFSDGLDTSNRNYTPLYDSWEDYYIKTFREDRVI